MMEGSEADLKAPGEMFSKSFKKFDRPRTNENRKVHE